MPIVVGVLGTVQKVEKSEVIENQRKGRSDLFYCIVKIG